MKAARISSGLPALTEGSSSATQRNQQDTVYNDSMLVGLVRLRAGGVKLTAEQVKRQTPTIGRLQTCAEPEARLARRSDQAALLLPPGDSHVPLAELHAVRVRVVDRGLIVSGTEVTFRRKIKTEHAQSWWCWPIDRAEYARSLAPDPIDLDEERDQIAAAVIA